MLVAQSYLTLCNPMDYNLHAPSSMGFSRQESWRGLPFPSPGDLPDSGMEPGPPTVQADSLHWSHQGRPCIVVCINKYLPLRQELLLSYRCLVHLKYSVRSVNVSILPLLCESTFETFFLLFLKIPESVQEANLQVLYMLRRTNIHRLIEFYPQEQELKREALCSNPLVHQIKRLIGRERPDLPKTT